MWCATKTFVCRAAKVALSNLQEAAFQLYRPIIARVIPPTPEPAKVDTKPEDGEVAAEEGEIEVPMPSAPEPGALNDGRRQSSCS
jgi:hypothetical protein